MRSRCIGQSEVSGHRRIRAAAGRAVAWLGFGVTASGGILGCGVTPVAPAEAPTTDPTLLYARLQLNHRAVTLSTAPGYATVRLTATPINAAGDTMTGVPAPTYQSLDTSAISVTADGLVTARVATSRAGVTATLTIGPETHADTTIIQVTDLASPSPLAVLSIHPIEPDSAVWSWEPIDSHGWEMFYSLGLVPYPWQVTLTARDAVDAPLVGLPVHYTALDTTVAKIDPQNGGVTIFVPGRARFVAEAMAYGVSKVDTVTYRITPTAIYDVVVLKGLGFQLASGSSSYSMPVRDIYVAPTGMVMWYSRLKLPTDTVDVVFDDPTSATMPPPIVCHYFFFTILSPEGCGAGNVRIPPAPPDGGPFAEGPYQIRQFMVPGIYPYHSEKLGVSGRVIVTADPTQ